MKLGYIKSCQKEAKVLDQKKKWKSQEQRKQLEDQKQDTVSTSKQMWAAFHGFRQRAFRNGNNTYWRIPPNHRNLNIYESFFEGIKYQRSFMFKIHELMIWTLSQIFLFVISRKYIISSQGVWSTPPLAKSWYFVLFKVEIFSKILIRVKSKRSTDQTMQDIFDLIDKVFILFIHKCL